jgi:hypothetical protein
MHPFVPCSCQLSLTFRFCYQNVRVTCLPHVCYMLNPFLSWLDHSSTWWNYKSWSWSLCIFLQPSVNFSYSQVFSPFLFSDSCYVDIRKYNVHISNIIPTKCIYSTGWWQTLAVCTVCTLLSPAPLYVTSSWYGIFFTFLFLLWISKYQVAAHISLISS